MNEPLLPTAATLRKWKWTTVATGSTAAALTLVYGTILIAGRDAGFLLPRLMQLGVYLSAIAAAACAGRYGMEGMRAHIDRRVAETADRMDRRLDTITNAMLEHGIRLTDITEELPRFRDSLHAHARTHVHTQGMAVYQAAPDKMTAIGMARVEPKAMGLDPGVIEMGERIARRLHEAD